MKRTSAIRFGLVVILFAGGAVGAQQNKPAATAEVRGVVTLDGTPLPAGRIVFHGRNASESAWATIDGGKYRVTGLSVGTTRVSVDTAYVQALAARLRQQVKLEEGRAKLMKEAKADTAAVDRRIKELKGRLKVVEAMEKRLKEVKVPARYGAPRTSGIQVEIKKGAQTFNLDLRG